MIYKKCEYLVCCSPEKIIKFSKIFWSVHFHYVKDVRTWIFSDPYFPVKKQNRRCSLRKKCPYSEFFWSAFSRIWTEYGEILRISPYSVRMRENTDQNNSEYGQFSRSCCPYTANYGSKKTCII